MAAAAERDRAIDVGGTTRRFGHEPLARDFGHPPQHELGVDAARAQLAVDHCPSRLAGPVGLISGGRPVLHDGH